MGNVLYMEGQCVVYGRPMCCIWNGNILYIVVYGRAICCTWKGHVLYMDEQTHHVLHQ